MTTFAKMPMITEAQTRPQWYSCALCYDRIWIVADDSPPNHVVVMRCTCKGGTEWLIQHLEAKHEYGPLPMLRRMLEKGWSPGLFRSMGYRLLQDLINPKPPAPNQPRPVVKVEPPVKTHADQSLPEEKDSFEDESKEGLWDAPW